MWSIFKEEALRQPADQTCILNLILAPVMSLLRRVSRWPGRPPDWRPLRCPATARKKSACALPPRASQPARMQNRPGSHWRATRLLRAAPQATTHLHRPLRRKTFLSTLDNRQRSSALHAFDDDKRTALTYVPQAASTRPARCKNGSLIRPVVTFTTHPRIPTSAKGRG